MPRAKRREVQALGEQVELFSEAVAAKDHVVVELTNQVIRVAVATGAELGVGLLAGHVKTS